MNTKSIGPRPVHIPQVETQDNSQSWLKARQAALSGFN